MAKKTPHEWAEEILEICKNGDANPEMVREVLNVLTFLNQPQEDRVDKLEARIRQLEASFRGLNRLGSGPREESQTEALRSIGKVK